MLQLMRARWVSRMELRCVSNDVCSSDWGLRRRLFTPIFYLALKFCMRKCILTTGGLILSPMEIAELREYREWNSNANLALQHEENSSDTFTVTFWHLANRVGLRARSHVHCPNKDSMASLFGTLFHRWSKTKPNHSQKLNSWFVQ